MITFLQTYMKKINELSLYSQKVLADQQQVILKGVLEEAIDKRDNKATIKAKMFYKSCMDLREYLIQLIIHLIEYEKYSNFRANT